MKHFCLFDPLGCSPTASMSQSLTTRVVLRLRMMGSLEEYTLVAVARIRSELAAILRILPSDIDIQVRALSARRRLAHLELIIAFTNPAAVQTAAILLEEIENGRISILGGFSIEGSKFSATLPSRSPSPSLDVAPSLLPSQLPNSVPSLAPSRGLPTLAPSHDTSLQPSLLPTQRPTQPSTSFAQRPVSPFLTPSLLPTARVEPALEPSLLRVPTFAMPNVAGEFEFSLQPSGSPVSVDSMGPSIGHDLPDHPFADTAPSPTQLDNLGDVTTSALTVLPILKPTHPPIAPLTRPPTNQPSLAPTVVPFTLAPSSPGDPPTTAKPTFAPSLIPCPGRPPCMDHGHCISAMGKCSCQAGWSVSSS